MDYDGQEYVDEMKENFNRKAAAGMNAVFQFNITGDGGGEWYFEIKDGKLTLAKGEHDNPDVTVTVAGETLAAMDAGTLDGETAVNTGKMTASGDLDLAVKIGVLFGS